MRKLTRNLIGATAVGMLTISTAFNVLADDYVSSGPGHASQEEIKPQETVDIPMVENGPVILGFEPGPETKMTNLNLKLNGIDGAITYRVYVNNGGFLPWFSDGRAAGGTEGSTYVQAIQIELTGEAGKNYDVYYQAVSNEAGKMGWAANGQLAGTTDIGQHLSGLSVQLVPKGQAAPGSSDNRFLSQYSGRITIAPHGTTCKAADGTGYNGWVNHDLTRYYFVDGIAVEGWQYIDGLKFYFTETGALVQDVDSLIGKQSKYVLKVNKALNCMTIYAKDGANGFVIPVKAMLTSVGDDTPLGTFRSPEKYRWRLMVNDSYTQYATRITAGFLFHSITYSEPNPNALLTFAYNNLGITRSLGCVRLTCENAKWIYDNCAIGTEIVIYEDANTPSPFDKPGVKQIPENQTYDPTDPNVAK